MFLKTFGKIIIKNIPKINLIMLKFYCSLIQWPHKQDSKSWFTSRDDRVPQKINTMMTIAHPSSRYRIGFSKCICALTKTFRCRRAIKINEKQNSNLRSRPPVDHLISFFRRTPSLTHTRHPSNLHLIRSSREIHPPRCAPGTFGPKHIRYKSEIARVHLVLNYTRGLLLPPWIRWEVISRRRMCVVCRVWGDGKLPDMRQWCANF